MSTQVTVDGPTWLALQQHLFKSTVEEAAMLYADVSHNHEDLCFTVVEAEFLDADDYDFQSSYHISLKDETRGRIIRRAWDSKRAIVEVHSHVGKFASAAFSPSDMQGFGDYVPHVMWRLRGKPYAAIVAAEGAFDGLVWTSADSPARQLEVIRHANSEIFPTAATLSLRGVK